MKLSLILFQCVELVVLGVLFFFLYYKEMKKVVIFLLISSVVGKT